MAWRRALLRLAVVATLALVGAPTHAAAPAAPANPAASQGTYADMVVITYDLVPGATSYQIRRVQAGRKPVAPFATDEDGYYEDTSAAQGVRYLYWVDACNADGCSDTSRSVQGWTALEPHPPTGLLATDGTFSTHVRLSYWPWQYEGVTHNVYRSTSAARDPGATPIATGVVGATYDDHTAAAGQVYWYWVSTVNVVGESGVSNGDSGFRGHVVATPTPGASATPPVALWLPMVIL